MTLTGPAHVPFTALIAVIVLLSGACGGASSDDAADDDIATATTATATGDAAPPHDPDGRIAALGEEFLLADLLALAVRPVVSTATTHEVGFQGIDADEVEGIAPISSSEANLERLASFTPDTIVATEFVVGEVGRAELSAIGDLLVVPDDATPVERVELLGDWFGREAEAEALVSAHDEAIESARGRMPDDCAVTMATIYPGPSLAAWVAGPTSLPQLAIDFGCTLVPSSEDHDPDGGGRVRLSMEEVGLLSGPVILLLQSDSVTGESDAVASIEADPLWQMLPAADAGRVVTLDRLGYPGIEGEVRAADDLADAIGTA